MKIDVNLDDLWTGHMNDSLAEELRQVIKDAITTEVTKIARAEVQLKRDQIAKVVAQSITQMRKGL